MTKFDVETHFISINSKGNNDIIDITDEIRTIISSSDFKEGSALIFVGGATAGITTIEYEPGLLQDYPAFFEKIIPSKNNYQHNETWHDGNGHAHVRAALQGASFTVPFLDKNLLLGTWQQIILIDFDNRARKRKVTVQLTGIKEK